MAELPDPLLKAAPGKAEESGARALDAADRRRPGRLEQISTELIPLIHEAAQDVDATDPLTARGLTVALVTSAKVWARPDISLAPARCGGFSTRMCRRRCRFPD